MTAAIKLISLLRACAPDAGWRAWCEQAVGEGIPGLERLVFNEVVPVDVRHDSASAGPYVAVIESWFTGSAECDSFAQQVRGAGEVVQLRVHQMLIHDGGRRPLPAKILVTLKGRPGATREATQHHWRTRHVEVGLVEHNATDFLRLYYQNHVIASDQCPGSATDYDGVPEYWLDEADLAAIGADSPVMRAIAEDEALFIDSSSIVTMMVREYELFCIDEASSGWPVETSLSADVT